MSKIFLTALSAFLALLLLPHVGAGQYRIDTWTTENGLPQNSINQMVKTRDGYIWLATNDGLVRFDGVNFKVFNKANSDGLDTNRIAQVHEDATGRLWIGGEDGSLLYYESGKFTVIGGPDDKRYNPRTALRDDGEGGVIFWLFPESRHFQYKNGQFVPWTIEGMPADAIFSHRARDGGFWFLKGQDVYWLKDGSQQVHAVPGEENRDVHEDKLGNIWITVDASHNQLYRVKNGRLQGFETPVSRHVDLQEDTAGNLWLFTFDRGVLRLDASRLNADDLTADDFRLFTTTDGLLSDACRVSTADSEGGVWTGSDKGLHRLSPQRVRVYSKRDGLEDENIYPILEARDGSVWLGAWQQSLIKYDGTKFSTFLNSDSFPFYSSLFEDRDGRLWFGNIGAVYYLENGKPVAFTSETGLIEDALVFHVISQDKHGAMWFGSSQGLSRYSNGQSTVFTIKDGLPNNVVFAFLEASDGRIWVGTREGIAIGESADDGTIRWSTLQEKDGLASNYTRSLYQDNDGVIWIGSYDGGLTRYKDGRATRFSQEHGLHSNGVFCVLEDNYGWLWMNSNQGIYRVRKQELNDFADGKVRFLTSIAYGKQDGLLNVEGNGGRQPAGIKDRTGKLWFPTAQGVAIVDPENVALNPLPPPVLIEDVSIERTPVPNDIFQAATRDQRTAIELRPGQNNLEIKYTGLSFVSSDQVKFKYRLEGAETEWNDVGTRRSAYYSYLPPGDYRFHVLAANRDGVWNEQGAVISIVVVPAYYQTIWFWALVAAVVFILVTLAYRYRLNQLQKINAARTAFARQLIEQQENERKRIASELHDALGQDLMVIKNRAGIGGEATAEDCSREQFARINDSASKALAEVRSITSDLRPLHLERLGLTTTLEEMIESVSTASGINIEFAIAPLDGVLTKESEMSLYRIVQECLNNIVKHSKAENAVVVVTASEGRVHITVSDDGTGFDTTVRAAGMGLVGIGERVHMLGGSYSIESSPRKGTVVKIEVDAATPPDTA